jgi:hypothetical protein
MTMNPREKNFLMTALAVAALFAGLGFSQACPKGLSEKALNAVNGTPAQNTNPMVSFNSASLEMCIPRIIEGANLPGPCQTLLGTH